jgi:hypothetical protein
LSAICTVAGRRFAIGSASHGCVLPILYNPRENTYPIPPADCKPDTACCGGEKSEFDFLIFLCCLKPRIMKIIWVAKLINIGIFKKKSLLCFGRPNYILSGFVSSLHLQSSFNCKTFDLYLSKIVPICIDTFLLTFS